MDFGFFINKSQKSGSYFFGIYKVKIGTLTLQRLYIFFQFTIFKYPIYNYQISNLQIFNLQISSQQICHSQIAQFRIFDFKLIIFQHFLNNIARVSRFCTFFHSSFEPILKFFQILTPESFH